MMAWESSPCMKRVKVSIEALMPCAKAKEPFGNRL